MDECRAEWKGQRHKQARKKGENQRIQIQYRKYERCMTEEIPEYLGRVQKKEKRWRDLDVRTRIEKTGDREERRCRMSIEERETIEHMWNGCSEMEERERKERGEILNEDRREKRWIKEI
ncbi:hypothetical protein MTP99_013562 [Tenebrio molitor]|nr:hypothetical protein MTP99_013562 [Tenebrio molitor]